MAMNINLSICLTDLPVSAMVKSDKNGKTYINLDAYVKDEPDQYGKDVALSVSRSKEEREANAPRVFVGNGKTFVYENSNKPLSQNDAAALPWAQGGNPNSPVPPSFQENDESDDLPF